MPRKINPQPHIEFSPRFDKDLDKTSVEVQVSFREVLELFRENPDNKALRNHSLAKQEKRYHGLWSIDVTNDYHAIYRKEENKIIFIALDTHKKLYGK